MTYAGGAGGGGSNDSTGHTDGSKGMSDTLMATWLKYWHLVTYIKTVLSGFDDLKATDLFIVPVPLQKNFKTAKSRMLDLGVTQTSSVPLGYKGKIEAE